MQSVDQDMPGQDVGPKPPKKRNAALTEAALVVVLCAIVYMAASYADLLEQFFDFSREHESWNLDELAVVALLLMFYFISLATRKWRQATRANRQLELANLELKQAAHEIRQLQGIIPICAKCKNIRDDEGYWQKVEAYIRDRADVKFTHSLCPDCFVLLYPDLNLPESYKKQLDERGK
jgi:hypothetical protein